ncbi:MAG: hypothetical protein AB8F65_07955 [Woeseiaceae bacterium]
MKFHRYGLTVVALLLAGCGSIDGTFEPACTAFEGDIIEVTGNRYQWVKFTDALEVDETGNRVNPFPGYPQSGSISRVGERITLTAANNGPVSSFFVRVREGERYLLTEAQAKGVAADPSMWECALRQRTQ